MSEYEYRPGFNLERTYREHASSIRQLLYNPASQFFISLDDRTLKAWSRDYLNPGNCKTLFGFTPTQPQACFISRICISVELNLVLAACLDSQLRVFNKRLSMETCMPWSPGVVMDMAYYTKRNEIITAGSYGVQVWYSFADYESYKRRDDVLNVLPMEFGVAKPWTFGKYQFARERFTLKVPASVAGEARQATDPNAGKIWCDQLHLSNAADTVFAIYPLSIYGFSLEDGSMTYSWSRMSYHPITACLFIPTRSLFISGTTAPSVTAWKVDERNALAKLKSLASIMAPVTGIVLHPAGHGLLTSTSDGFVTMWHIDTLEMLFQMKVPVAATNLGFNTSQSIQIVTAKSIKIMHIQEVSEQFMEVNSVPIQLQQLSYGLVLATFQDCSVRLIDTKAATTAISVVPQLSTHSLVTAVCSLPAGSLFAVLTNGHVHLWDLHLTKPPALSEVWTHLAKEPPCSVAFLEGELMPAAVAHRLGLSTKPDGSGCDDHLVVGASSGDVLFCDLRRRGLVVLRFPTHKAEPVQHICLDQDRARLVTASREVIKIWDLHRLTCLCTSSLPFRVTQLALLDSKIIAGTASGTIHILSIYHGSVEEYGAVTADHMGPVTGLGPSIWLQHFVSSSLDGNIKVYSSGKELKVTVCMGQPALCACYLNDEGDLLVGLRNQLVQVPAKSYQSLVATPDREAKKKPLYQTNALSHVPRTLLRCCTCKLQALATQAVPERYRLNSAGSDRTTTTTASTAASVPDSPTHTHISHPTTPPTRTAKPPAPDSPARTPDFGSTPSTPDTAADLSRTVQFSKPDSPAANLKRSKLCADLKRSSIPRCITRANSLADALRGADPQLLRIHESELTRGPGLDEELGKGVPVPLEAHLVAEGSGLPAKFHIRESATGGYDLYIDGQEPSPPSSSGSESDGWGSYSGSGSGSEEDADGPTYKLGAIVVKDRRGLGASDPDNEEMATHATSLTGLQVYKSRRLAAMQDAAKKAGGGPGQQALLRAGLEAEFRKTLRVVADPEAFTEKKPHPKADSGRTVGFAAGVGEEEGAGGEGKKERKVKKKKKKKKKKKQVAVGTELDLLLRNTRDWNVIQGVRELEAQSSLQRAAVRVLMPGTLASVPGKGRAGG